MWISQGKTVTWVRLSGKYLHSIYFGHFAIYLPKRIKVSGNLTKFWLKQKCTVFFETRCIYNRKLLYLSCGLSFPDEIWFADMDLSFWRERRHPIRNRSGRHLENRYDILSSGALLREIWHATPTLNNRPLSSYGRLLVPHVCASDSTNITSNAIYCIFVP